MALEPIIECTVRDTNATTIALTGDDSVLIRYHSNAHVVMTAEAQGDAAINLDMCIIRNAAETGYGMEHTFNGVESDTFTLSTEDSSGRIGRLTHTCEMIKYNELTCGVGASRPDADGNFQVAVSGNYFKGNFGVRSNELQLSYRLRTAGDIYGAWSSPVSVPVEPKDGYYAVVFSITLPDHSKAYDLEITARDALTETYAYRMNVRSIPVFHWGQDDVTFETDVNIKGDLRLKGSGNYGNRLFFGDSELCYIGEKSDDEMTIYADEKLHLWADEVTLNGSPAALSEFGEWTPYFSNSSANYTLQHGWYNKVGSEKTGGVVTVGFMLKATISAGYVGNAISISGMPFTPFTHAAGGGMCSGAYMQSEMNFQCFVAETSGEITTRAQLCTDISGGTLTTSAQGCRYPTSGELTLSGTITFVI